MDAQLEVEILPSDDAAQTVCPICGEDLSLSSMAGMLYDDHQPLGCVCEKCLAQQPKQAAKRVRERALRLYAFVEKARHYLRGEPWDLRMDKVRRRAEHWDALAMRLSCLSQWPVRDGTMEA